MNFGVYHFSILYYDMMNYSYYGIRDGVSLDIGILKNFDFNLFNKRNSIKLGVAGYNVTNSKLSSEYSEYYSEPLPVIIRAGVSHRIIFPDKSPDERKDYFSIFTHLEYEKVVNSKLNEVFKIGSEIAWNDIIFFRLGYFNSKIIDGFSVQLGNSVYNEPSVYQSEFTVGGGLKLPVDKWLKFKNECSLKLDYTPISHKNYERFEKYPYRYKNLSISLNYIP